MVAATLIETPFVARAPAPLPAKPMPTEPPTAAANAPTNASIDCCALAIRTKLPAVAFTLESTMRDRTCAKSFEVMTAEFRIPAVSS